MAQDAWQAHPLNRSPKIVKNTLALLALAASGLLLVPVGAKAQATGGVFVDGNLGRASLDHESIDGSDTSYGISAGYRWAIGTGTLIGFEVGYMDFGRFSVPLTLTAIIPIGTPPPDPVTTTSRVPTDITGRTLGANGRFNFSPDWFISGRAGFIRTRVVSHLRISPIDGSIVRERRGYDADGWYAGAGIGYDFGSHLSLGLNYDYYNTKKRSAKTGPGVLSLGGEYRF